MDIDTITDLVIRYVEGLNNSPFDRMTKQHIKKYVRHNYLNEVFPYIHIFDTDTRYLKIKVTLK